MAALGPDLSRANLSTRQEVTRDIKDILDWLSELIPGKSKTRAREKAVATYATIVGALLVARAVDDPELSDEILEAARASISANA
jgi:TetR/AcrR family transcriptional repressor of nem operon